MSTKAAVVEQAVAPAREAETSFKRTCECGTHVVGGGPCAACCAAGRPDGSVPSEVYDTLRQGGHSLDSSARVFLESRFDDSIRVPATAIRSDLSLGKSDDRYEREADSVAARTVATPDAKTPRKSADLSNVRVHTGRAADAAAAAVRARAFSVGGNIVFRAGEYRPGTASGNRLIAHEIAHMSQPGAATVIRRKESGGDVPAVDPNSLKIPPDMRIPPVPNENKTDAKVDSGPPEPQAQAAPRADKSAMSKPTMSLDPAVKATMPPVPDALKAGVPPEKAPKTEEPPKSISDLSTGSLDFIDYELAEHERWGAVGKAGSADRAMFVAKELGKGVLRSLETVAFDSAKGHVVGKATDKLGKMAQSGLEKWAKELGAKAEDFKPLGSIGAVIGGAMAAYDLASRDWKSTGETIGKFGQGADIYEKLANDIDAISNIVQIASDVLKVIAGIIGAISIAIWAITIITVGVASPLASTLTTIALFIVKVTMVLDKLDQFVLKQLITIFRALHTFYSDADPREVVAAGQSLEEAAKGSASAIGGFLANKAEQKLGHSGEGGSGGKKGSKKVPDHPDPPPASGKGPTVTGTPSVEGGQVSPQNAEPISATAKPTTPEMLGGQKTGAPLEPTGVQKKAASSETVGEQKDATPAAKAGAPITEPNATELPVQKAKAPNVDLPAVPASVAPELKQKTSAVKGEPDLSKQSAPLTDEKGAPKTIAEPVKPTDKNKPADETTPKKPADATKKPTKTGPAEEGPIPDKAEIVGAAYLAKLRLEADWERVPADDQIRLMGKGKDARDQHEVRMEDSRAKAKALGLTDTPTSKARSEFMEKEESASQKILTKELGDLNEERAKIQAGAIEADKKGTTPKAKPMTPQEEADFEKNFPKGDEVVPEEGQKIEVKEYQMKFPKMVEKGVTTDRETGLTGPYKDQPKAKGSGQEADHIIASSKAKLMNPLYNADPALTTDIPEDVHDVKTFEGDKSDVKEAIRLKDLAEKGKGPSSTQVFTDSVDQLHFAIDEAAKKRALAAADVAKLPPETHKLLNDMAETAAVKKKSAEDMANENHKTAAADISAGKPDSTSMASDETHQAAVSAATAKRIAAEAKATSERDTAVKAAKDAFDDRAKIAAENRKALDDESPVLLKQQTDEAAAKRDKALGAADPTQKDAILKTYDDDVKQAEARHRRRMADHVVSEKEYVDSRSGKILADATENAETRFKTAIGAAADREKNDLLKANDSRRDRAVNEAELYHRKDLEQIRQKRLEEVTKLKAAGKEEPVVSAEPGDTAEPAKNPEPTKMPEPITASPIEKSPGAAMATPTATPVPLADTSVKPPISSPEAKPEPIKPVEAKAEPQVAKRTEKPLVRPYRRPAPIAVKKTETATPAALPPQVQDPKTMEKADEDKDDDLAIAPLAPNAGNEDNPLAQMGKQLTQLKENVTDDKSMKTKFMEGFNEAKSEGEKKEKSEAVTESVYPDYPPLPGSPPITPQTVVDVQNQILSTLDARAEAEDTKARMSLQANHHTNNKEPLSKAKAKNSDVLNARGAHEAAVRRRQEANGKKQGSEGDAGNQILDYDGSKATIQGILVPMRFFARFTGLASSLPDSPDVLVGAKNGILRMSAKTKQFVGNLESVDKSMTAQKAAQSERLADTKKDAATLQDTKSKSQETQTSLDDTKDKTESINKENEEKEKAAKDISGNAAKASTGLDKQAQEKTSQAQSLAAQLEAWAQAHRQARLDAIEKKKKEMADRGFKSIQGAEK